MGFWSRAFKSQEIQRLERLEAHAATIGKSLQSAMELLEELEDKHQRLRGVVYGRKLHKEPLAEGTEEPQERPSAAPKETSRMTREELKRHLALSGRFIPGRPPIHTQE